MCGCSHEERFGLRIQLESILHGPLLDVSGTSGEKGQTGSCVVDAYRQEPSVIGVLMASDAMGRDDVSDWTAIYTANSSGPSTDLCGTPTSKVFSEDRYCIASRTVSGPADKTESRKAQSQTLRTLSALSVSRDIPCRRLQTGRGRLTLRFLCGEPQCAVIKTSSRSVSVECP